MSNSIFNLWCKTTPDPWTTDRFGVVRGGPEQQYTNSSIQAQIANFMRSEMVTEEERQANAEFTAAAHRALPELEAELKRLRLALEPFAAIARHFAASASAKHYGDQLYTWHLVPGADPVTLKLSDCQRAAIMLDTIEWVKPL